MANREPTPAGAVLVAIDISKLRNDVLIEVPGTVRRKRVIVVNRAEHDRFVELLASLGRLVIAGFAATGNYHRPLAYRLLAAGVSLRLVSSVALARTREALHNSWDKNDPKDAQIILHMLRIGATQVYFDPIHNGIQAFRSSPRRMRSSPRPRPSFGIAWSPTICRCTFQKRRASPATRAVTGF